jgi:2Fe-2S type ferredoxin
MPVGTVDYFHETSGYGFITSDETTGDIFFHMAEVGDEDPEPTQVVQFNYKETEEGLRATSLSIVDRHNEGEELKNRNVESNEGCISCMTDSQVPNLSTVESPSPRPDIEYDMVKDGEVIGSGGQAIVRRASLPDPEPPDTVAVKEPHAPSETLESDTIESFFEEARMWQTLARRERKHQFRESNHIVDIVAIGDTLPWIAMEYMDGGSLASRLETHPEGLPMDEALWIGECLCKGVKLAHDNGVAHLDLKPANVLFRETSGDSWNIPKIADWGLARTLLDKSQSMEAFSVEYAAPEQFDSYQFGNPDTFTDIYQVGAIVYEMLTGDPPYTGSKASVMHDVVYGNDPVSLSEHRDEIPEPLDIAVQIAIERQKGDRYNTIQGFKQALRAIRNNSRLPPTVARRLDDQDSGRNQGTVETDANTKKEQPEARPDTTSSSKQTKSTSSQALSLNRVRSKLETLTGNNRRAVSGEHLAPQLDATRSEVYSVLDELKSSGDVEYVSGQGYRLKRSGSAYQETSTVGKNEGTGSLADKVGPTHETVVEYLNYAVVDEHSWDPHDPAIFEKATGIGLSKDDHGVLEVGVGEYILEVAEEQGYEWPFSCRAGACANCAAIVVEGEVEMDPQSILSDEEVENKNIRLTCVGTPKTDTVKLIYNAKHLDYLQNRVI